jgi:hypothetical protein
MQPSERIDEQIAGLNDWRGELYARLRALVNQADTDLSEDWKWGTAVWVNQKGAVCAVSAFKQHVKMNFFKGASLPDPHSLFNSGLEAKKMRSIDFFQGDTVDEAALSELIRTAAAADQAGKE